MERYTKLTEHRKHRIEQLVTAIRNKYSIGGRPFTEGDFRRICRGEGIKLARHRRYAWYATFPPLKGLLGCALTLPNGTRVIWLRSFFEPEINLPTAFHELGHALMKHTSEEASYLLAQRDFDGYRDHQQEIEADYFSELALKGDRK